MAITSLKPIKAKNKAQVVDGRMTEKASTCGYTSAEARGIFGQRKYKEKGGVVIDAKAYERKKQSMIVRTRKGKPKKRRHPELPHPVTKAEAERIDAHGARRAEGELRRYKSLHADVKERMAERQRKAFEKLAVR